jgi:hypothetical protein
MTPEEFAEEIINQVPVPIWEVMDGTRYLTEFRKQIKRVCRRALKAERDACKQIVRDVKWHPEPEGWNEACEMIEERIEARGGKKS